MFPKFSMVKMIQLARGAETMTVAVTIDGVPSPISEERIPVLLSKENEGGPWVKTGATMSAVEISYKGIKAIVPILTNVKGMP